jgi:hypothetical protein
VNIVLILAGTILALAAIVALAGLTPRGRAARTIAHARLEGALGHVEGRSRDREGDAA